MSKEFNYDTVLELGRIPDIDLAKKLGVSAQAIFQARKRRNIKPLNKAKRCNINWDLVPLGKMTDDHLADLLGCSGGYVCRKRQERNIPSYGMLYRTTENEASYYGESIIDLWLHNKNINHKFQFKVGKYRVDWFIVEKNEIWEFLGMWDHKIYGDNYRKNYLIKEKYLKEYGYSVKRIYKDELDEFKKDVDISKIFCVADFKCSGCDRGNVKHQAKGLCAMCYGRFHNGKSFGPPKITFLKDSDDFACITCGSKNRHKQVKNNCSKCYLKIRKKNKKV